MDAMKKNLLLVLLLCLPLGGLHASRDVELAQPAELDGAVRIDIKYGRLRIVGTPRQEVRVTGEIDEKLNPARAERAGEENRANRSE